VKGWAEHWAEIIERKRAEEKTHPISKAVSTSDAISMANMSRKVIYLIKRLSICTATQPIS